MYTIYEVPGVKVGCTSRSPEVRVKEQGYTQFRVIEEAVDINVASERERYWQEKLGYGRDTVSYITTKAFLDKCQTSTARQNWKKSIKVSKRWRSARDRWSEKRLKTIQQYSLKGELIEEWKQAKLAAAYVGTSIVNIRGCLIGRQKTAGGYIWKYKSML